MAKLIIGNKTFEGTVEEIKALMAESGAVDKPAEPALRKIDVSEAQAGDFVKYENAPVSYITAGKLYEIAEIDGEGDPQILDDDGDDYDTFEELFEVFTSRPAPEEAEQALKVGDYAVITGEGDLPELNTHHFPVGTLVKVKKAAADLENDDRVCAEYLDGHDYWFVHLSHLRKATDAEVVAVKAPAAPKLKVGDYAKVVGSTNGYDKAGDIVKIVEDDSSDIPYKNEHLNGDYAGFQDAKSLVPATDEEVAQAKAEDKWTKIGRKPGEFKKGDVVRVVSDDDYNGVSGEIEDYAPSQKYSVGIRTFTKDYRAPLPEFVELVAPVEARFDI